MRRFAPPEDGATSATAWSPVRASSHADGAPRGAAGAPVREGPVVDLRHPEIAAAVLYRRPLFFPSTQASSMIPPRCSFCEHENPVGAKYCNECGTLLDLVFCNCGAVNGVTDAACYRCGASLALPQAPARPIGLEAELREVEEQLRGYERQLKKPEQHASRSERQPMADQQPPAAAAGQARRGLEQEFRGFEHGSRAPSRPPRDSRRNHPFRGPENRQPAGRHCPSASRPTHRAGGGTGMRLPRSSS